MRRVEHDLNIPESVGPGDPQRCDTYVDKWVGVEGTFTGTVKVQGQLTATGGWLDVGTATGGTSAAIEVKPPFFNVRVDTTGVASGTPAATLVGFDVRTQA